jgi:hypothetical protein
MARSKNFFRFTDKLSDVTYYYIKGKPCVRRLPVCKTGNPSPAQIAIQAKFALASKFVRCLSPLLTISIPAIKGMRKTNMVTSHILNHAILGTYPDLRIDYPSIFISKGSLGNSGEAKASYQSRNIVFTWDHEIEDHCNCAKANDKAILVIYCESINECIYSVNLINRSAGTASFPVLKFLGHKVQTWIGFISANGKLISQSTYTGALFIT